MYRTCLSIALLGALVATNVDAAPIKLRLGNTNPPRAHLNKQIFIPWAKKVTAASEGVLEIQFSQAAPSAATRRHTIR